MVRYAMEILLSESSIITTYYFGWSTSSIAIFLASLGLTVLPVNMVIWSYIGNIFEDLHLTSPFCWFVLVNIGSFSLCP